MIGGEPEFNDQRIMEFVTHGGQVVAVTNYEHAEILPEVGEHLVYKHKEYLIDKVVHHFDEDDDGEAYIHSTTIYVKYTGEV